MYGCIRGVLGHGVFPGSRAEAEGQAEATCCTAAPFFLSLLLLLLCLSVVVVAFFFVPSPQSRAEQSRAEKAADSHEGVAGEGLSAG